MEAPKYALTVQEAAQALGIGKTKAYELVNLGVIPSISIGGKRVVPVKLLEEKLATWCLDARDAG